MGGGAKYLRKYFSGKYHVKFGHFINFSYIYLQAKCLPPFLVFPVWMVLDVTEQVEKTSQKCRG